MTISAALFFMYPSVTNWTMRNDDLSTLVWNDSSPVPTLSEIQAYIAAHEYRELRAPEYPPLTDQLDAIMKGGQALTDMQALCMAVKAKYPKPE